MLKMLRSMKWPYRRSASPAPILVDIPPIAVLLFLFHRSRLGLGVAVTKTGNQFDVKVLTGMKSFNVKGTHRQQQQPPLPTYTRAFPIPGTQTGNKFDGKVFSSDNKEVMTTSGTLVVNNEGFKLDSTLTDSASKKEVLTLTTDILPNRGQGLTADIALTTPDKKKSFKIHCKHPFGSNADSFFCIFPI